MDLGFRKEKKNRVFPILNIVFYVVHFVMAISIDREVPDLLKRLL